MNLSYDIYISLLCAGLFPNALQIYYKYLIYANIFAKKYTKKCTIADQLRGISTARLRLAIAMRGVRPLRPAESGGGGAHITIL